MANIIQEKSIEKSNKYFFRDFIFKKLKNNEKLKSEKGCL